MSRIPLSLMVTAVLSLGACASTSRRLSGYGSLAGTAPNATSLRGESTGVSFAGKGHAAYSCTYKTYDVTKDFDRILGLGASHASAKPGILLQGKGVLNGQFDTIQLPRSPIVISVELPIRNPRRTIENPSVDTIQAAVAALQRDIDAELTELHSTFMHSTKLVDSFEETAFFFGVNLSYKGPLVQAGLDSAFHSNRSAESHVMAVKHIEELYTITFSDELLRDEGAFLASSVTDADLARLESEGVIGQENPPAYVKSVTYGRIILATAAFTSEANTRQLEAGVNATYGGLDLNLRMSDTYKNLAQSAHFDVLALGGTTAEALAALRAASIDKMFGPARATTAEPLYYTINWLKSPRPTAKVGSTTTYTTRECVPTGGSEPCRIACPAGWSEVAGQGTCVSSYGATLGEPKVWGDGHGHMNATPLGMTFRVADPNNLATAAKVVWSSVYASGGIWNDPSKYGFTVSCGGGFTRRVSRAEAWNWRPGPAITWEPVPAGEACGVSQVNSNDSWTPGLQGDGTVLVPMRVESFSRPVFAPGDSRCY